MLGDARHALHAHVCRAGTRTRHSRATVKAARHTVQGCVHDWESMGRLLRPGTCAKITHIELRIEHRAPRLLPARCDADAWSCLDFQALGRRRGHDDPCVDGGSARYEIRIVCRALQESTRPNRHPGYGKLGPGFQQNPFNWDFAGFWAVPPRFLDGGGTRAAARASSALRARGAGLRVFFLLASVASDSRDVIVLS